jgi:maleylacetoacetate isomerase
LPILEYLNETRKNVGVNYIPEDPVKCAKARCIAEIINSGIQPLQNLNVVQRLEKEKRKEWLHHYIDKGLVSIEQLLQETSADGLFCVDNKLSIADICLVPQVYGAKRYKVDVSKYPLISSVNSNLEKNPEFFRAHAHNQIDTTSKFKQ